MSSVVKNSLLLLAVNMLHANLPVVCPFRITTMNSESATVRRSAQDAQGRVHELEEMIARKDQENHTNSRALERKDKIYRDTLAEIELKVATSSCFHICYVNVNV